MTAHCNRCHRKLERDQYGRLKECTCAVLVTVPDEATIRLAGAATAYKGTLDSVLKVLKTVKDRQVHLNPQAMLMTVEGLISKLEEKI